MPQRARLQDDKQLTMDTYISSTKPKLPETTIGSRNDGNFYRVSEHSDIFLCDDYTLNSNS